MYVCMYPWYVCMQDLKYEEIEKEHHRLLQLIKQDHHSNKQQQIPQEPRYTYLPTYLPTYLRFLMMIATYLS
jgi:hypothetical protein